MKKVLALALLLLLILSIVGCNLQSNQEQQIRFYYCSSDPAYAEENGVISPELRSGIHQEPLNKIINFYLAGPKSEDLHSPFPEGLRILEADQNGSTMYLTVSNQLCDLTGMDLTLACACLTLTFMDLRQVQQVVITPEDGLLDGQRSITMDKNALLMQIGTTEGE